MGWVICPNAGTCARESAPLIHEALALIQASLLPLALRIWHNPCWYFHEDIQCSKPPPLRRQFLSGAGFPNTLFQRNESLIRERWKKKSTNTIKANSGVCRPHHWHHAASQRALNRTPYRVHQCHSLNGNCLKGLLVCDMRYFFLSRRKAAKAGISVQVPSNGNKTHGCLPCQDVSFSKDFLLALEGN